MANSVEIKRTVYGTAEFGKVINTTFTTFTQPTIAQDTDTPEELFRLYDKLYYVIDIEGETNSHEYLIKRSSELFKYTANTEEIQPLLDEIAQLRQQNLALNQQILTIQTKT